MSRATIPIIGNNSHKISFSKNLTHGRKFIPLHLNRLRSPGKVSKNLKENLSEELSPLGRT
jgi:hypothetical protein